MPKPKPRVIQTTPIPVSPDRQRQAVTAASRTLHTARQAHQEALFRYNNTAPTSSEFADAAQELQSTSSLLIAARSAFQTVCATI